MSGSSPPPGWEAIESTFNGERMLTLMEACPPGASPELREAWAVRRAANITGVCPSCGAVFTVADPNRHQRRAAAAKARKAGQRPAPAALAPRDGLSQVDMFHEPACPAGDKQLRRLVAASMN